MDTSSSHPWRLSSDSSMTKLSRFSRNNNVCSPLLLPARGIARRQAGRQAGTRCQGKAKGEGRCCDDQYLALDDLWSRLTRFLRLHRSIFYKQEFKIKTKYTRYSRYARVDKIPRYYPDEIILFEYDEKKYIYIYFYRVQKLSRNLLLFFPSFSRLEDDEYGQRQKFSFLFLSSSSSSPLFPSPSLVIDSLCGREG